MRLIEETTMQIVQDIGNEFKLLINKPISIIPQNGIRIKVSVCYLFHNKRIRCKMYVGNVDDIGNNCASDNSHLIGSRVICLTDNDDNEYPEYLSVTNRNQLISIQNITSSILPKFIPSIPGFLIVYSLLDELNGNVLLLGAGYLTNCLLSLLKSHFKHLTNTCKFFIVDENASMLVNLKRNYGFVNLIHLDASTYDVYNSERIKSVLNERLIDISIDFTANKFCMDCLNNKKSNQCKEYVLNNKYIRQSLYNPINNKWLQENCLQIEWPTFNIFNAQTLQILNRKLVLKEIEEVSLFKFC